MLSERLDLGATKTPLERADRLRVMLGVEPALWIKRDDAMTVGGGGNKLRKLEFLLCAARAEGATAIGSIGGPTSNHLRLVAAASIRVGMSPYAFVIGDANPSRGGNLLLLELLGASVVSLEPGRSNLEVERAARERFLGMCQETKQHGYWITFGGTGLVGDLGYVLAMRELEVQLKRHGRRARAIYVALGTGGTAVGLAAGAALFSPDTEVIGYAVMPKGAQVFSGLGSVASQLKSLLEGPLQAPGRKAKLRVEHGQVGQGYARPTDAGKAAIELLAQSEAIFLDPVYTAKAFAGMVEELRSGRYRAEDDIVFIHTGGLPGLFYRTGGFETK